MAKEFVSFFVRVTPELHEQLVNVAKDHGQSLSELSRRALQAYIDNINGVDATTSDAKLATIGDVHRIIAEAMKANVVVNSTIGGDNIQGGKKIHR